MMRNPCWLLSIVLLTLASCTPPLTGGAYQDIPGVRADKVTAAVGETVEVTVTGGFEAAPNYYLEEFIQPGVSLGACFLYASDMATEGGLCLGGERPLPNGLSMVDGTTFVKDIGDVVVRRGEHRSLEHAFTFTSNQPGVVVIVPVYQFNYGADVDPSTEPGESIQIVFE